ncbi:MAG: type II toxin-antitoxin system ParD family antitoxin [Pirellulales bacterium]
MNIPISPELQRRIDAQIAGGGFATSDEVLREAMDTLERRQRGLVAMRAMVAEAEADVDAGRTGPFDREAVKREVRERLAEQGVRE